MIYLTPEELYVRTGYKRAADQIRWLKRKGIPHEVNRLGKPVVRKDDKQPHEFSEPELGPVA